MLLGGFGCFWVVFEVLVWLLMCYALLCAFQLFWVVFSCFGCFQAVWVCLGLISDAFVSYGAFDWVWPRLS